MVLVVQRLSVQKMDNHNSHASIEAFEFCNVNNIHVLSLPPHTSHRLQPLDVTFYGPLKKAFYRECDFFMKCNNFQKITQYDVAGIFNKAYMKVCSMDKAVNGFKYTGIMPFDSSLFDDEFADLEREEREINNAELANQAVENPVSANSANGNQQESIDPQFIVEADFTFVNGVSNTDQISPSIFAEIVSSNGSNENNQNLNNTGHLREEGSGSSLEMSVLLPTIAPIPVSKTSSTKINTVRKQHSEILTSPSMKKVLYDQKIKKEINLQKKEETLKRKLDREKKKAQKEEETRKKKAEKEEETRKKKAEKEEKTRKQKEIENAKKTAKQLEIKIKKEKIEQKRVKKLKPKKKLIQEKKKVSKKGIKEERAKKRPKSSTSLRI